MRTIDADRFKEYIRKGAEVSAPYYKYKTTLLKVNGWMPLPEPYRE